MRYFLAAAEHESINKAATRLAVSAPAISRTISRLEDELGVQLFERIGRNIALTVAGKQLQAEASRLLAEMDDIKRKFKPSPHHVAISLKGTEFGLAVFTGEILNKLRQSRVAFSLEVKVGETSKAVERALADGESHLGLVAQKPSASFQYLHLGTFPSRTYVGPKHPLAAFAQAKKTVPVAEVLQHEFVSFLEPVFSESESGFVSNDGWRDDEFQRIIGCKTESVEAAVQAIESGLYVGYLPEPLTKNREVFPLKISGCPYTCETDVYLIAKKSLDLSWLRAFKFSTSG